MPKNCFVLTKKAHASKKRKAASVIAVMFIRRMVSIKHIIARSQKENNFCNAI
jgi:hypothetical protein